MQDVTREMKSTRLSRPLVVLLLGDVVVLVLVTLAGFARHNELETGVPRMPATFLPWLLAWLLVAPALEAFDIQRARQPNQLWRPFYAMILTSPLAALFRAIWLETTIVPVFVVVFGGISTLAMLAWRALYCLVASRGEQPNG